MKILSVQQFNDHKWLDIIFLLLFIGIMSRVHWQRMTFPTRWSWRPGTKTFLFCFVFSVGFRSGDLAWQDLDLVVLYPYLYRLGCVWHGPAFMLPLLMQQFKPTCLNCCIRSGNMNAGRTVKKKKCVYIHTYTYSWFTFKK